MGSQLALGLVLRFADQGSASARTALDSVQRALNGVRQRGTSTADAVSRVWDRLGRGGKASREVAAAADAAARSLDKLGSGRAAAGVAQITREAAAATQALDKARQAADQAAKAGSPARGANGRFLPRGASGVDPQLPGSSSSGARAVNLAAIGRGGMAVGAGYMAGQAVLAPPVKKTQDYERSLASLANTGAPDGTLADRRALMQQMDAGIMDAVRKGGGSREGALSTLDNMVASGAYEKVTDAIKDLPTLIKAGSASGADTAELANIAIKARQTMGITDMSGVLAKAMRAGQLGGFELKDMAKWLPQQMAAAKGAGLSGESGLIALLAANQAAVVTAGSKDEAGNNLVNLLAKINSSDTAVDAKKLGIDLTGSLAAAREKGVNGLDAFVNLVEQVVAKDGKYGALSKKAATATGSDQKAMYGDMANILQGSAIGKLIQDRQALMALVGIMQQRKSKESNTEEIRSKTAAANEKNSIDPAYDLMSGTAGAKAEMLAAEKANAMQQAMDNVNPVLGKMADWLGGMAREYPNFTAAAVASTTALAALAAAAGAASLSNLLTGGKSEGAAAKMLGKAGDVLNPVGALVGAGAVGYGLGTVVYDQMLAGTSAGDKVGEFVAQVAAFFGNQEAAQALSVNQQAEAAQALKDAANALKESRPSVYLNGDSLGRSVDEYNTVQARRK